MRRLPMTVLFLFAAGSAAAGLAAPPPKTTAPPPSPVAAAEERLHADDPDGALALLAGHLKRQPDDPKALFLRGSARCMNGETAACRADYERAVALDPAMRQGWLSLGALAVAEQRWGDALTAFARAEQLAPDLAENDLNAGAIHLMAGDLAAASQRFNSFLEREPRSADAYYRVAANYALAGYAALAARALEHAIALDERSRVRARLDPNFEPMLEQPPFPTLFATDRWVPPPDYVVARRAYPRRYDGPEGKLLGAVLDAVQLSGRPFDPRVDATPDWALLWSEFRIRVGTNDAGQGEVELAAPATTFPPAEWQRRTEAFFQTVARQLALAER
ncbi:MAG: hypothetical protein KA189_06220 [Thermoanaerobaculia bacterium]|nr:hypothetical protein [Thermoanaerobaculia bacterium]MBP7813196.1 hypothetical protein [Thermoanaerobaculia bacterium]HRR14480.1 hypothetical protein [Thermoanaerobaculia bacterium]